MCNRCWRVLVCWVKDLWLWPTTCCSPGLQSSSDTFVRAACTSGGSTGPRWSTAKASGTGWLSWFTRESSRWSGKRWADDGIPPVQRNFEYNFEWKLNCNLFSRKFDSPENWVCSYSVMYGNSRKLHECLSIYLTNSTLFCGKRELSGK